MQKIAKICLFLKLTFKMTDLQFLNICKDHNVIPKFLRFKVANGALRTFLTYKQCQRKLLREEIYNKKLLVSQPDRDSKLLSKMSNQL